MKILFLDDNDFRHRTFRSLLTTDCIPEMTFTAEQAIAALDNSDAPFDVVFLDHDLAEDHYGAEDYAAKVGTGKDVSDYIVAKLPEAKWPKCCIVHSLNASRAPQMHQDLEFAGIRSVVLPFGSPQFNSTVRGVK